MGKPSFRIFRLQQKMVRRTSDGSPLGNGGCCPNCCDGLGECRSMALSISWGGFRRLGNGRKGGWFPKIGGKPPKSSHFNRVPILGYSYFWKHLGGGFKYCSFSPLFGEDEPNLRSIFFQMGWFNHQPEEFWCFFSSPGGPMRKQHLPPFP